MARQKTGDQQNETNTIKKEKKSIFNIIHSTFQIPNTHKKEKKT